VTMRGESGDAAGASIDCSIEEKHIDAAFVQTPCRAGRRLE